MTALVLAFFTGVMLLQQLPVLPSPHWLLLTPALLLPWLLRANWLQRPRWCLLALTAGFAWAWLHATLAVSRPAIGPELHGRDLVVVGRVSGLPEADGPRLRFELIPELLLDAEHTVPVGGRLRLNWYGAAADPPPPGRRLWLQVRLKPPRGYMNPGGFDYEGWLFRRGVVGTGYVKRVLPEARREALALRYPGLLNTAPPPAAQIDRWRLHLRQLLQQRFADRPGTTAILQALAIGDRGNIDAGRWQVLRRTGTTHLVAISGLHVGLVAGFAMLLTRLLWRRSARLCRRLASQRAGALAAVLAALVYSALAGFAIPTQRALLMIAIAMLMRWRQGNIPVSRVLAGALLGVLLLDPAAVLDWGFWLSFAAVMLILYGSSGRPLARQRGGVAVGVHFRIALGLMPLLLLGFNQVSLISPLANLPAVPWVSLVTVPSLLAGLALTGVAGWLGGGLLDLAAFSVDMLNKWLDIAAMSPVSEWWSHTPLWWTWPFGVIGVVWLLGPAGLPGRWLGVPALASLLLVPPATPAPGEMELTLLDVGQGLAAVIRTRHHVLVYDTGPRSSPRFDAGMAVLVPFLRHHGYRVVDLLLVSHGDRDHAGGVDSLLRQIPAWQVLWGAGYPRRPGIAPCHAPRRWTWDQVQFEILYPFDVDEWRRSGGDNNGSCVLRARSPRGDSVLLAGDIGVKTERALLRRLGRDGGLDSDILIVPHHGSTTSSSPAFIRAVSPRWALYANGYLNRFGFPRPVIRRRYQAAGAREWQTSDQGAISFMLGRDAVLGPFAYRASHRRYWHRPETP